MPRVLFFGTHPKQFNGYSKVVYEIAKCMSKMPDYSLSVYGFQNFYDNASHRKDLPDNVIVYDAFANEAPKNMGFGVGQVKEFVKLNKPDVCVVYNDMLVIAQIVTQLKAVENRTFKIICYVDQVYLHQKKEFIEFINKNADVAILFTKDWETCIVKQGVSVPTSVLEHGFNPQAYYPIPRSIARQYFGIKTDDFIILNLNRNQPRKRWDTCLKAFAEIVSRHQNEPIKMMIATAIQGAWNLMEIYERELSKRDVSMEVGMKHIILLDNPQRITDEETNILYNVADIGINTCDGEGFGLCNFEQGGIGIPQVVPRLGGFVDFFDEECAMMADPKMAYYVDSSRDMVCGEALLCDYMDFVDGIEAYYLNKELREKHGAAARKRILRDYKWSDLTNKLCKTIDDTLKWREQASQKAPEMVSVKELVNEVENIDIGTIKALVSADAAVPEKASKTKKKMGKKKTKEEIRKLKKKLEKLLAAEDSDESDQSHESDDDSEEE